MHSFFPLDLPLPRIYSFYLTLFVRHRSKTEYSEQRQNKQLFTLKFYALTSVLQRESVVLLRL